MSLLKKIFTPRAQKPSNRCFVSWRNQRQSSAEDQLVMNVMSDVDRTMSEPQRADVTDAVVAEQPATQSFAAASADSVAERSVIDVDVTTVDEQESAAVKPAERTPCSSAQSHTVRYTVFLCLFIHVNMYCG